VPKKVVNSGKTKVFSFSGSGKWEQQPMHGWSIWIDGAQEYRTYSPRHVAIAMALRDFWILNRGSAFSWRETLANLRHFVRGVGTPNRNDFARAKEIIRELGPNYMSPDKEQFVYACTRGPNAVAGFVTEQYAAEKYEVKTHVEFKVREARLAAATVEPGAKEFAIPVREKPLKTKTF